MKPLNITGFTIVETMLFLGISGLLAMGILIGSGTSINVQRYRDSVTSLQSVLQKQYSDVSNVSNDSTTNTCSDATNIPRGQSDCVLLGRFITSDSKSLLIKSITGRIPANSVSTNDLLALRAYNIQVSPLLSETYDMEWGSSITKVRGDPMSFSMLVLRSPTSGIIRSFIDPTTAWGDGQIQGKVLLASKLNESATVCVNSNGLFTGAKMAVLINANATGANDIETLGDNSGCH